MEVALLVLRAVVGARFAGHGSQKLFGWFGGHRLAGTASFFERAGLRPGKRGGRAWASSRNAPRSSSARRRRCSPRTRGR